MKYNTVNLLLALLEKIILKLDLDKVLDVGSFKNLLIEKLAAVGIEYKIEYDKLIEHFIEISKTDEFKAILKTDEFKQLYYISNSTFTFRYDLDLFLESAEVKKIWGTNEWKRVTELELVNQINIIAQSVSESDWQLFQKVALLPSLFELLIYFRMDLIFEDDGFSIEKINENKFLIHSLNKSFNWKISYCSEYKIRTHLKKYLNKDKEKNKVIDGTIEASRKAKSILLGGSEDKQQQFDSFYFLVFFIFEVECTIINYFFEKRKQKTAAYNRLLNDVSSLGIDLHQLFQAFFSCSRGMNSLFSSADMRNIWCNYLDILQEDKKKQKNRELAQKAQTLAEELCPDKMIPIPGGNNQHKEKLPCPNYLYAALLNEKANKTDDKFVRLCREAAKIYIGRNGKEFSGDQLANVLHTMVANSDGWDKFLRIHGDKIKRLKKKINWQI